MALHNFCLIINCYGPTCIYLMDYQGGSYKWINFLWMKFLSLSFIRKTKAERYLDISTYRSAKHPGRIRTYSVYRLSVLIVHMCLYGIHLFRVIASTIATKLNTTSATSSNIFAKPNTTSPIWTHFGLLADDNGKPKSTVDCITCRM